MTLVDLFEYMQICLDHDRKGNVSINLSVAWTLFKYLGVADILNLRETCRSTSRLASYDM
jgi:hypothetical protein